MPRPFSTGPALALLLTGLLALPLQAQPAETLAQKLEAFLHQQQEAYRIPGLSVAILHRGEVLFQRGFGKASVEFDLPADELTVYQLASTTKMFTGIAVSLLVEEGKLTLDTPVSQFLGDLPPGWDAITIRHLLSHTSGMQNKWDHPRYAYMSEEEKNALSGADIITLVGEIALRFEPGTGWSYTQSAYTLLGLIVEQVARMPFPDFLRTRVFEPLGMHQSRFGGSSVVVPSRNPTAYSWQDSVLMNWFWPFGPTDFPAAGLNTSVADMTRLFLALDAGALLTSQSKQALWTAYVLPDGTSTGYGLGWDVRHRDDRLFVGHEGGGAVWVTHLPDERLTVIALSNLAGARADELPFDLAELVLDYLKAQP